MSEPVSAPTNSANSNEKADLLGGDATPQGEPSYDDAALRKQEAALAHLAETSKKIAAFNADSVRNVPQMAASLAAHAARLQALRDAIIALDARAARCRERAIALAERDGVDLSALALKSREDAVES